MTKQENTLTPLFIILLDQEVLECSKHLKIVKEIKTQHVVKP